jgi:putative sigma-54 modulation protein
MDISLKGRGIEVTPAMREYTQKKIGKLSEFEPGLRNSEVTCKTEKNGHKVEVTLHGDSVMLRAEEKRPDFYEAVDCVFEKLEHQARKHRKRIIDRNRQHSAREVPEGFVPTDLNAYEAPQAQEPETVANGRPRIARVKRFFMKPMSAEEAAIQMDMMGHQFYVFRNAAARGGDINVVYRRDDGTFGLIQPGDEEG